jgi:hypothetical protein
MPTKPLGPEAQAFVRRVLDILREKGATQDYCPRCSTSDWNVDVLGIQVHSLSSDPRVLGQWRYTPYVPMGAAPVLAIVCKNCGYMMFHNLDVLDIWPG